MAIKSVSIRIEEEMLEKLGFVADYEGRSVNSHILVLIRENIKAFEQEHGEIDGTIRPDVNVKPGRRSNRWTQDITLRPLYSALQMQCRLSRIYEID
ncbi:hypothetical protein B5F22_06885 [Pseudoflavonifractor sp. An187]|nr:hypothetical protein B5F22_06885 [Pseudoflavonifractor sp. An187]